MQTSNEVKQQFLADIKTLLAKYDTPKEKAEIEAVDHYQGYPECGTDVRMIVSVPSIWDENYNQVRERVEIDLGRLFSN